MYHKSNSDWNLSHWNRLLIEGLVEDGAPWDWTTLGTVKSKQKARAKVVAKSVGVWAAHDLVIAMPQVAAGLKVSKNFSEGKEFRKGDVLVELEGPTSEVFALERPFLNLAAYACGIATMTARMVKKVHEACPVSPPRVVLTRKTLPGLRDLAIHSVRVAGGFPHRVNLAGGVLIKENHIAAVGGLSKAVALAREVAPHGLKIEVEVQTMKELEQAISAQADGVLLDNFSPTEVRAALSLVKKASFKPFIEVSGGLTEATIADYALPGVQVLSVGALTHSVIACDLTWLVKKS